MAGSRVGAARVVPRLGRYAPYGVLGGVAAGTVLVAFLDPHEKGHYPTCPFLLMTGLYCPGCGGLRMVNDLAHGDVGAAFGSNPLLFLLIPFAVYLWARWAVLSARGAAMHSVLLRPRPVYGLVAVIAAFWIVRNLPFAHVLAP